MIAYLAQLLGMQPDEGDTGFSFELYGLAPTAAVGLSGDLGEVLGREFDASLAYDYPSIDALLDHLTASNLIVP